MSRQLHSSASIVYLIMSGAMAFCSALVLTTLAVYYVIV